jgi:hypothetical protein
MGSTRTVPVNQSADPFPEGWEPLRLISILGISYDRELAQSSRRAIWCNLDSYDCA